MKLINYIASIFSKKRGIVEVNETSPLDKALLVNLEKFELSNEETVFLDLLFKILDQDKNQMEAILQTFSKFDISIEDSKVSINIETEIPALIIGGGSRISKLKEALDVFFEGKYVFINIFEKREKSVYFKYKASCLKSY